MVLSLVKPPAAAGPLSRIGDYLFAARGPGLCLWLRRRTTFAHERTATRGPPDPLFHRGPCRRRPRPMPPTPGAVRRRAGGGGVVQGSCGLGLCVLVCVSWSVCLGLYVLAFVSLGCCLGCAVLAFLFEYGICGGLTPAFSCCRKPKRRRSVGCRQSAARRC